MVWSGRVVTLICDKFCPNYKIYAGVFFINAVDFFRKRSTQDNLFIYVQCIIASSDVRSWIRKSKRICGIQTPIAIFYIFMYFFTENLLNFREKWFLVRINETKPHAIKMLWNKKRFYDRFYNIFGNDSKQWGKSICLKWKHLFIFCIQYKFH